MPNPATIRIPRRSSLLFPAFWAIVSAMGCGGTVGEALRPKAEDSASAVLNAAVPTCKGPLKPIKPLVVDLDADTRVELEAAMTNGVAVVAYDCASFKVLSMCTVPDSVYAYAGVSRKEQVVQMNNLDDLHANIPIKAVDLGAEIQGGRSIDLALVFVGRRASPIAKLMRSELQGSCEGATHFVQNATLGAFAMGTGSVGKVAAVAELFSYGGGASSSSERKALNKDGDLEDCRKSSPGAPEPPPECRSAIKVELIPVAEDAPLAPPAAIELSAASTAVTAASAAAAPAKGSAKEDKAEKEPEVELNPCPNGYLYADGMCTKKADTAHLCAPGDEADCVVQCDKGSVESCYNLAVLLRKAAFGKGKAKKAEADGRSILLLKKACDGGHGDGCEYLGTVMLQAVEEPTKVDIDASIELYKKACDLGSGEGCDSLGGMLTDKDWKSYDLTAGMAAYERGCNLGYGFACYDLAEFYLKGSKKVPKDIDRGIGLVKRSCSAGDAVNCDMLGNIFEKGTYKVPVDNDRALFFYTKACRLDAAECAWASQLAEKVKKDAEALALATRGCEGTGRSDWSSCFVLGTLYHDGRGTAPDAARAKAIWTQICENGNGDDDACGKRGIPMKE